MDEPSIETAEGRQAFRDIWRERLHPQLGQALDALDARDAALAEKDAAIEHWKDMTGAGGERCVNLERERDELQAALAEARAAERERIAARLEAQAARYADPDDLGIVWGWGSITEYLRAEARALRDPG